MVRQFLRQEGLEAPLNEQRLMNAWPEVMGQAISRYTGEMFVKNQVLYVHLKSPALRQNMMMQRAQIVRRLNECVGSQVIVNIELR